MYRAWITNKLSFRARSDAARINFNRWNYGSLHAYEPYDGQTSALHINRGHSSTSQTDHSVTNKHCIFKQEAIQGNCMAKVQSPQTASFVYTFFFAQQKLTYRFCALHTTRQTRPSTLDGESSPFFGWMQIAEIPRWSKFTYPTENYRSSLITSPALPCHVIGWNPSFHSWSGLSCKCK